MAPPATGPPSYLRSLYYKWRMLKLPWRRQWLVGYDLSGNTYWEFKNQLRPGRARRIAKYPSTVHYGDVKLTPSWLQWLRHTRADAPTVEEQQYDLLRQDNLKQLAAQADARWAQKESYLDNPAKTGQPQPLMQPRDPGGYVPQSEHDSREGVRSVVGDPRQVEGSIQGRDVDEGRFKGKTKEKASPWAEWEAQKRGVPGDGWQPEAWSPGKAESR